MAVLAASIDANLEADGDARGVTVGGAGCAVDELSDLGELVRVYGQRVQRFCGSMTGDRDEALDLAQDVFVVAIERRASFRGASSVETWLLGIAVRVCRSWIRRRAVRRRVLGLFASSQAEVVSGLTAFVDENDEIARGLQAMDVKSREVLVLRYFEGREVDELTEILKLSRGGVDQRLSRARRKLGDWLEGR